MPKTTEPANDSVRAATLRAEAERLDELADDNAEDNPMWADYLAKRAAWCRKLARDFEG